MEDNKPIDLQKLTEYMTNNSFEYNDKSYGDDYEFTELIINKQIDRALLMLSHNKDLKFDKNLLRNNNNEEGCRGDNMCSIYFEDLINDICVTTYSYVDVIKILQFLTPENIIYDDCICRNECKKLAHDYIEYCSYCIQKDKINVARAIYIMFDIDNMELLYHHHIKHNVDTLKKAYSIIMESQNIIPLKRRNIPTLDIIEFVKNGVHLNCYDIIRWYYKINPCAYTKEKIDEVYKSVLDKDRWQIDNIKQVFEQILNKN